MDLLDRLLEHDRWATTSLLDLCASLPDDQLDREFDIGHRTLRQTFMHAIYNIEGWTLRMEERSSEPVLPEDRAIPTLLAWHERTWESFATLARRIRDEQRMDDIFTDVLDGQTGEMTYGGATLHVILHNEGHRTEAVHMLSRLDIPEVPEIDHGLWDYVRRGY